VEEGEELVVEALLVQELVQHLLGGGVVVEDAQHVGVLVPEDELHRSVLPGLEAGRRRQEVPELQVLARRERGEDGPLLGELVLDVLDPREPFEGGLQLVLAQQLTSGPQLVQHQLQPQLCHLVLDDEEHLVVVRGLAERVLCA
jgi:hypothetical protein